MKPATSKLIQIAGDPFLPKGASVELENLDGFGRNGLALKEILREKSGFFCFEQALRFFSSATSEASWGIHEWNAQDLWKCEYFGLAESVFCFAEDIFGNQFCLNGNNIGMFNAETGDIEEISGTVEEFCERILEDYNSMTGYRFAHEWQELHGRLPLRQRLLPKKPFVTGGAYDLSNMIAIDSVRLMKNLGNLAHQIHDLPDGSYIQFKIL
jgi:hypothetical protein